VKSAANVSYYNETKRGKLKIYFKSLYRWFVKETR